MITAEYCSETVEVLDVWEASGRKIASIRVDDGRKPWTLYSHGGPVVTNAITVPVGLLRNVRYVPDARLLEKVEQILKDKQTWYSGEIYPVIGNWVMLKRGQDGLYLHVKGYDLAMQIASFSPDGLKISYRHRRKFEEWEKNTRANRTIQYSDGFPF